MLPGTWVFRANSTTNAFPLSIVFALENWVKPILKDRLYGAASTCASRKQYLNFFFNYFSSNSHIPIEHELTEVNDLTLSKHFSRRRASSNSSAETWSPLPTAQIDTGGRASSPPSRASSLQRTSRPTQGRRTYDVRYDVA